MIYDNLEIERNTIEVYFRRVNLNKLLNGLMYCTNIGMHNSNCCVYNDIPEDVFGTAAYKIFSNRTYDETHYIYEKSCEDMVSEFESEKCVFNLLYKYGEKTLQTDDKYPVCKYETMLNWWKSGIKIGQDIITAAYMAKRDICNYETTTYFSWPAVIKSDNERLNKILEQGMAENHFHLNGSTQIFPASWAYLMNNYKEIPKLIKPFNTRLDKDMFYDNDDNRYGWNVQLRIAAVIRWYLFNEIIVDDTKGEKTNFSSFEVSQFIIDLANKYVLPSENKFNDFNNKINTLKDRYGIRNEDGVVIDYAICFNIADEERCNRLLSGERYFLYNCFRCTYQNRFDDIQKQLLYIYLGIKLSFRGELIQSNDRLGFKNFADYQDRKDLVFDNKKGYKRELMLSSVVSTMRSQNIKALEVRIAPRKRKRQYRKYIIGNDSIIKKYNTLHREDEFLSQYKLKQFDCNSKVFYVVHFIKGRDCCNQIDNFINTKCRHYRLRKETHKNARTLAQALELDNDIRLRIRGIDAASGEIGCRPEVMASEFRYLRFFNPINDNTNPFKEKNPLNLKVTYHVGEDFNHIIDGLRAIDEAILFLNMKRNDRLGHALALATDPQSYYSLRKNIIVLSKQDLLDDLAWFMYKTGMLGITVASSDRDMIYRKMFLLFSDIYAPYITSAEYNWNMHDYVNAWKLRGDSPELYYFQEYCEIDDFYVNGYKLNQRNPMIEDNIRKNKRSAVLYSLYHFSLGVRKEGEKQIKFEITPTMINSIKELQRRMQFEIADNGIAIECNPTSNYVIGSFKRLDKHPILQFYNAGLESNDESVSNSAQISVSINTDDQGVFDTSLSNEFTVIAAALEMLKDENGVQIYRPSQVYKWINDVRKMGIEQSFLL